MKKIILISLNLLLAACSGVKPISPKRVVAEKVDTAKLYDQNFLLKVNSAKEKYRKGKTDIALKELTSIPENNLRPTEKASKRNLIGVMHFSKKRFEEAIKEFETASSMSKDDPFLDSQVYLNLGSAYFKLNQPEKALSYLNQVDYPHLQDSEAKKFHQLHAILSEQLGKKDQGIASMIRALSDKKTMEDLKLDPKYLTLEEKFFKLTESERVRMLENFDEERNVVIPTLVFKSIDVAVRDGMKDKAHDYEEWLLKRYAENSDVMMKLGGKSTIVKMTDSKLNSMIIGVALPITGERKSLGERALNGIDIAIQELNTNPDKKFQIEVKDTQSSNAEGAFAVSELIEKNNVVAIIGGLIPSSATKEYLEAKKRGVLFISLSPVYLPKDEKNHLLLEISGSIESQVNQLFSDKNLSKFGKRPAIIYPRNELGEAYVNEFWRKSKLLNLEVNGIVSYDKNGSDFKDPVKNILGIKFTRDREEEAAIVNDIAHLEQNKSIKRLQNLQPQIDFDWVFAPGLPRDMVQVLPNFNYFDAFNLNYIGVPAWRSELMTNEGYRYGNVYFVDEIVNQNETEFTKNYFAKFNTAPKIVETISYDAIKIITDIVKEAENLQARSDLESFIQKKGTIVGESGSWKLEDDIWIKNLSMFKIKREGIESF
jgi:ABC-type branched-subunit amino acid transport system substrate-binding protein